MKIVIADDERDVLDTLVEIARFDGSHEVLGAANGEEAIGAVNRLGGIDLLITDVVMEPVNGFELREKLLEAYPNLITIFVSGYDLSDYSEILHGNKILAKPVDSAELTEAIRTAENNLRMFESVRDQMKGEAAGGGGEEAGAAVAAGGDGGGQEAGSITADLSHLMQKQGFTGKLDQFQLVDIIQMCCLSRRTGRLRLSKGVEKGVMFLEEGNIVHAVCGRLVGEEAVYRIIDWDFGEFNLDEGITVDKRTIQAGWESVVMEGVRRRDESRGEVEETEDTGLLGKVLGDFEVQKKLGDGQWGAVYLARQVSVDRPVALKVLREDLHLNSEAVQQFIADASAKANVQHPSIVSVYEAGEANGVYFYARELVEGITLADIAAEGSALDDQSALRVIRVVSEALSYLNHYKVAHSEIEASNIFVNREGGCMVANLATTRGEQTIPVQQEISTLARIVSAATQEGAAVSLEIKGLLSRMRQEGQGGFLSWGALIQSVRAIEPKVVPKDAYKLSERDEAAIRAVEQEKKRQKWTTILSAVSFLVLVALVIVVVSWQLVWKHRTRVFDEMVRVPAGEFLYGDGVTESLPEYWISKHEVSIGMYERFLDYLEENPTTEFDHANQPPGKSHVPARWLLMKEAAENRRVTFDGANLTKDSPIFNIDWWDAYAYAKWRGQRLPTEKEWEKAARGTDGRQYPWGDRFDAEKVNSSADFSPNPTLPGAIDGYNRWAPVDAMPGDLSPYGVMGMAGNVAEWTASWADDPRSAGTIPVIRGGSFGSVDVQGNPDVRATRRTVLLLPEQTDVRLGFRTASDTPPEE